MSTERADPLDELGPAPLAEQIEPYRDFGDAELAVTLLAFEKQYGGPGVSSPAVRGFDYECQNCEENVRGVTRPDGPPMACPLCGEHPGALTLGRGPQ